MLLIYILHYIYKKTLSQNTVSTLKVRIIYTHEHMLLLSLTLIKINLVQKIHHVNCQSVVSF